MRSSLLLLCLTPVFGQSLLSPPAPALYRDGSGKPTLLQGIRGAWSAVLAENQEALPAGALRSFTLAGEPFVTYLAGSQEFIHWDQDTRSLARIPFEAAGRVLAIGPASPKAELLRLVTSSELGLSMLDVDLRTGEVRRSEPLYGLEQPLAVTPEGDIVALPRSGGEEISSADWISAGVMVLYGSKNLWAWELGGGLTPLPAEAPPPLELLWRETGLIEKPVGSEFVFPSAPPGSTSSARFRIRNNTLEPVNITRLSIDPSPFRTFDQFYPPHVIPGGGYADFSIRFAPEATGAFASTLYINALRFTLRGVSEAMPELEVLEDSEWRRLDPASPYNLGSVERRATLERSFRVVLPPGAGAPAAPVTLTGNGFDLVSPGAGGFLVRFSGETAGNYSATISLSGRSYTLTARVLDFKAPRPALEPVLNELESARSQKLSIRFDEPARADFTGTLRLSFRPDDPGVATDPGVTLLPEQRPVVTFRLRTGASLAEFSNGADHVFLETGTTAGTITLTLVVDQYLVDSRFRILPALIGLTAAKADFSDVNARVTLTGFDNTRSASRIAFTFFLKNGQTAEPGRVEADISSSFKSYFAQNPAVAGAWQLKAIFPVSGAADLLESVEVEILNSQGVRRTDRLRFE